MILLQYIMETPAIVRVIVALSVILIVNSLSRQLLLSIACGALILAFWAGQTPSMMLETAQQSALALNNVLLLLAVCQVIWLSRQMQYAGVMEDLVTSIRQKLSKRGAMAMLPALIGFLPMPGGALFSAPMLESCDPENHTGSTLKAMTNHWFRHVWECWWPMFPGVLLTMELTGFDIPVMLMLGLPISLAAILSGYLLLLRRIPDPGRAQQHPPIHENDAGCLEVLKLLTPILVVVLTYALIRTGHGIASGRLPALPGLNRYLPMNVGLLLAMAVLQAERPQGRSKWKEIILSRQVLNMALIVLAVRIYGAFIEAESPAGYDLIGQMRMELNSWGIPVVAVIMLLPFITGLATGMAVGYVGASFPIVLSLIGADPTFGEMFSMTLLAYGFGYMGFFLSPVHVCLVVTCRHFDTPVLKTFAGLLAPALLVLLAVVALSLMWNIVLP